MKKKKIVIILCAIFIVAVAAAAFIPMLSKNDEATSDTVKVWLVESCENSKYGTETAFEYDEEGNLVSVAEYTDGELNYRFNFDVKGNCIQEIYYIDGEIHQQTDFTYDEKGSLIKEAYTFSNDDDWENEYFYDEKGLRVKSTSTQPGVSSAGLYEYNDEGKLLLRYSEDGAYKIEYTYDDKGNHIKRTDFSDGKETERYEYKYDEQNRVIEKDWFSTDTPETYNCYTYEYDEASRIISAKSYSCFVGENATGEPYYQVVNKYDEKGLKLSMEETDSYNTYVTEFVYDEEGRLTEINHTDSALGNSECRYISVIITPEQAEKIRITQKMIYDELVYDDEIIIEE